MGHHKWEKKLKLSEERPRETRFVNGQGRKKKRRRGKRGEHIPWGFGPRRVLGGGGGSIRQGLSRGQGWGLVVPLQKKKNTWPGQKKKRKPQSYAVSENTQEKRRKHGRG